MAPEPAPGGAAYGRVLTPDGLAVSRAELVLVQVELADIVKGVVAIASVGFFCLFTDAFCPTNTATAADRFGRFQFDPDEMKADATMSVTASRRPVDGRDVVASVEVVTGDLPDPQRVPDLVLWEPALSIEPSAAGARLTWPALAAGPRGDEVVYAVHAVNPAELIRQPFDLVTGLHEPTVDLDVRAPEDQPLQVFVSATTRTTVDGADATFIYRSAGVALPSDVDRRPPSRGAACAVDVGGALVAAATPCPATDGDLTQHAEVLGPGDCAIDTAGCVATPHHRICVDLATPATVDLVVIRTPFPHNMGVALSADGRTFVDLGPVVAEDDVPVGRVFPVKVDPPQRARYACAVDRGHGFQGHIIQEISAWTT